MSVKNSPLKFSQIIFWSVISAAFIGPGTITMALKAGSNYQLNLIWAIFFSILACIILQESVSRITITSGLTLGEAIQKKYGRGRIINYNILLTAAVIFGCTAYQAGNITGAVRGVQLAVNTQKLAIVLSIFIFAFGLMWIERLKLITSILGILVSIMALLFLIMSMKTNFSASDIILSFVQPKIPRSSSILIIGLIGTTIVPYNLFMGSGLSRNRDLKSTRYGLTGAILLGGLITIFILITGTIIQGEFSFDTISSTIQSKIGKWGTFAFATGLFAAGFTSSVTAPLAAAITARTIWPNSNTRHQRSIYRLTWITVLSIGTLFSLLDYHPVFIIIMAQVINGLILPFVALSIFFVINDKRIISAKYKNGVIANMVLMLVVGMTIFLGIFHLVSVGMNILNVISGIPYEMIIAGIISLIIILIMAIHISRNRNPV
jgi:Mn2+/Fe2+ NRAMP family transporter